MPSDREYSRGFLTPDGYYRQELTHMRNTKGYVEENGELDLGNILGIAAGLTFGVGSAKLLYDNGSFKKYIQKFAKDLANSEGLLAYKNMMDSVKEITTNPDGNLITDMIDIVHNNTIKNATEKAKIESLNKKQRLFEDLETIQYMKQKRKISYELKQQQLDDKVRMTLDSAMGRDLIEKMTLDRFKEAEIFEKSGLRHATVQDILRTDRLTGTDKNILEMFAKERPEILKTMADRAILVNEAGELLDFRDTINAVKKMGMSAIDDYAIPLLGINPLKMFGVQDLLHLTEKEPPLFMHMEPHQIQPHISQRIDELGASHIYSNGKVYDTVDGSVLYNNMTLKRANGGTAATSTVGIFGMSKNVVTEKWDNPIGHQAANLGRILDFGMQEERYPTKIDWMHPGTALPVVSQKISETLSPFKVEQTGPRSEMFGKDTKWIAVNKAKKLGEDGFGSQFVAGRKSTKDITTATFVPYKLNERMNRSIQPFGIALSKDSLGSAMDTFTGLVGKRVLPVVLAIGALKYIDYVMENKETGISPKDKIVEGMANADINVAGFRSKIGLNDRMEKLKDLSPGLEFIAEMPIIGKLFDSKSKEEAEEYWEEGYDPIRKGRFWTLGNTPYTGNRIDYFRPNLKRRVNSDYQYTDVKYGSKKEFWENNWLPTPTNPFSPIKHFITDPYHWEKKHYDDRPYPITGGIAELREIPVIGGFLDATVGRVLKPQKRMHMEYWQGDKLNTDMTVESVPFEEITRPAPGMSGTPGRTTLPDAKQDTYDEVAYSTSSGITSIYATPESINVWEINNKLKEASIKRVQGATQVNKGSVPYGPLEDKTFKPFNPNGIAGAVENAYMDATDQSGFYGFVFKSAFGDGEVNRPRLATSSSLYSYSDTFWDKSLGGFGGELSEIFRRFAPNKSYQMKKNEVNPIRNTMPTWLPGPEYYINFLHGDPYEKITEGEYRLPGAGYEAMYGLEDPTEFKIGSSSIGSDIPDLIKHFLQVDDIEISENESLKKILDSGTKTHENMENEWMKIGYAVAHEYYVKDEENNIEGWVDAIVKDNTAKKGYAVSDIKTINQRGYEEVLKTGKVKENYKAQINFYMHMMGYDKGYLHFVNRDDPNATPVTVSFDYDKDYMQSVYDKLEKSRDIMRQALDEGVIQRGDLYKPLDRFRILADVAPYSENYRFYNSLMSKMALKDDEKEEVQRIRKRVTQVKEKMRVTPYKFSTSNIIQETVTIKDVLDDGTILTEEYEYNPLKLAGVKFSTNEDTVEGKKAMSLLKGRLRKGSKVAIGLNADELNRVNKDTYSTMDAVIDVNDKRNLNKYMIDTGLAEEDEKDDSATGINARYAKSEIAYGKLFETISHRDTPFNTKFMQARSALEQYERRDVYGKDWQDWTSPISDFLVPTIQNTIRKSPMIAVSTGMFVGAMFGAPSNRYGKLVGGAIGGVIGLAGSLAVQAKEKTTGEAYIPERRQKEREMNEYFDVLKYVKNMKLFDQYRKEAIKQEGVDPGEFIAKNKQEGEARKSQMEYLESIKRKLHNQNISFQEAKQAVNFKGDDRAELENYLNGRISKLKTHREAEAITPLAAQAIMYYNESEKTAYGYDPGEPVQNILAALNRKERKYFMPFLEAPEEERDQILRIAPSYMKRALQSAYGRQVDTKQSLESYFSDHYLPDEDWAGWNPEVNLDDVKIKMVKHEAMDNSEFDIWEDDVLRAEHLKIPLPKLNYNERSSVVRDKLRSVLSNMGVENIEVDVTVTDTPGINVQMDIEKDRRKDIEDYVGSYGLLP